MKTFLFNWPQNEDFNDEKLCLFCYKMWMKATLELYC